LSQVLGRGAQAAARGATRFASQVLDRGAHAVARGAATLIVVRQGWQRRDAVTAGEQQLGMCAAGRLYPSRRCTWPIASWFRRLRLRPNTSAWASSELPGANRTIFKAVNYHKREVSDFACGMKSRRWFSLELLGAAAAIRAWCFLERPLRSPLRQHFPRGFVFSSCFLQKFGSGPRGGWQ
jgi:hypothetical protein